ELRASVRWRSTYPWLPGAVYVLLAVGALTLVTHWPAFAALAFAGVAAVVAIAFERPKIPHLDDDLAMTLVPAVVLLSLTYFVPSLFP
ncbi:MAG TPA: hypothetical protein VKT21_02240, partial [Thermoplasmata archaeon]|nr:hypothetical protein [Thermoplasmata archaeon]